MKKTIDLEAVLAPIPGENPAGENLRYNPVYDEIQEARRADDTLDQGDWQHDVKTSDWDRVFSLAVDTLTEKTKDLQIAAWLLESLTVTEGFAGVSLGLKIIIGFLQDFWDQVYPEIEDDDLDYRVGPLEFLNARVWLAIKQISLTDNRTAQGCSWLQWQESRQAGKEEMAEDFDRAVGSSSKSFYETLYGDITDCLQQFKLLDEIVDEKFGREAPRLAEFKAALEDCDLLVAKILKEKKEQEPDAVSSEPVPEEQESELENEMVMQEPAPGTGQPPSVKSPSPTGPVATYRVNRLLGSAGIEESVWQDALAKLESTGIKQALEQLLGASCSAQSVREETNFRLLMAKLCLKANRPDLARPIAEKLNALMEELQLNRWESPIWIAEVLDTLIQCLTYEGASDDDIYKSKELLTRLCTLDITKAMGHMS